MVLLTRVLLAAARGNFIDKLRINVKGGLGGLGLIKHGGLGGRGGNVYVVGDSTASLKNITSKFPGQRIKAGNGLNASGKCLQGGPGEDVLIKCPLGVQVVMDGGIVIGEIDKEDDKVLIAKGGLGGCPKNSFVGDKGHQHNINLDLKLIADVGLVGFPNAGKSTLLKGLSRASPKIANYPFTTVAPKLATIMYDDQRQITIADLPGLIEGAHMNVGMGHKFLKHVERTKILLVIVDLFGFRLNPLYPLRSSFENVLLLNKELEMYKEELVDKPSLLVINKIDIPGSDEKLDELMKNLDAAKKDLESVDEILRPSKLLEFDDILTISAKKKSNLEEVKLKLREMLDRHYDQNKEIQEKLEEEHANLFAWANTEHRGDGLV